VTDSATNSHTVGLSMAIDTTGASFHTTPCYCARVDGRRPLEQSGGGGADLIALDLPAFVHDASSTGFTCNVAVVNVGADFTDQLNQLLVAAARDSWGVIWLGIED
jgi:hypothetical protein